MNAENTQQYVNPVKAPKTLILAIAALLVLTATTTLIWNFQGIPDNLFDVDSWIAMPISTAWILVYIFVVFVVVDYTYKAYFKYEGICRTGIVILMLLGFMLPIRIASEFLVSVL